MSSPFRHINIHQLLINFSIENLKTYVSKIEEFLESERINLNENFDEETKGWSEEEKNGYGETLSDEYWLLAESHPNLLRSSMFISIYSFFEKEIRELCKFYNKERSDYKFPSSKGISKIAKYLKCLEYNYEFQFSKEIEEWKSINEVYREIRNIIAHDGGEVENDEVEKYTVLFKDVPLKIENSTGNLILQRELCFSFLEDIARFFDKLLGLIEDNK